MSMITNLKLSPDEVRVLIDALSTSIIFLVEDGADGEIINEKINMYNYIHDIADKNYPGSLNTNSELKEIMIALGVRRK